MEERHVETLESYLRETMRERHVGKWFLVPGRNNGSHYVDCMVDYHMVHLKFCISLSVPSRWDPINACLMVPYQKVHWICGKHLGSVTPLQAATVCLVFAN